MVFIGFARYDLRLPDAGSLKDKRAVVRSLTSMLHQRFRCAVAEVEHQQLRQRAAVGVSIVSGEHFHARKVLQQIGRAVSAQPGVELLAEDADVWSDSDR